MGEREAYFQALLDMFTTEGWKVLMREMDDQLSMTKDTALSARSWDEFNMLRGRRQAFSELRMLEATIREQLEEDDPDADV